MDRHSQALETPEHGLRLLIVSPSAFVRNFIDAGVQADRRIRVVAVAANARVAGELTRRYAPHVIILDKELAGLGNEILMDVPARTGSMPVLMLASVTNNRTSIDLQMVQPGPVDVVDLLRKRPTHRGPCPLAETIVSAAGEATGVGASALTSGRAAAFRSAGRVQKWILVGASTGGVEAIETLLQSFPEDCPPTLITQHMPPQFLKSFAARLNDRVRPRVEIARDGICPKAGDVYVAPGGDSHLVLDPVDRRLRLWRGPKVSGYRPSVDAMFESAIPYASKTVAVILTGMGGDGARSMKALRDGGAVCIGQDRDSSVIYGMPRMAFELGATQIELPLAEIAAHALAAAQTSGMAIEGGN